jgi:DNA processing protein
MTAIGDIWLLNHGLLGIVWPRSASVYSHAVIKELFEVWQSYYYVTISWGAKWVDMMCHTYSLKYSVPTIVVLWEWLRHALCSSKRDFLEQVVHAWGLIMSEFPLDMKPSKWSFPQRNRIIAWLSECVFLPAAWVKSWSLLTVEYAMQMHVPVYTVPGSIYDATSRWTNEYLCEGKVSWIVNFSTLFGKFFWRKQSSSSNQSQIQLTDSQKNLLSLLPQSKEKLLAQWYWLADITLLELSWMISINASGEIMRK